MGWNDYMTGGGLFGGYGGYDQLAADARRRANNNGLLTSGALIMRNAVGPNNMGFMGNVSSALLAGRESFESTLDREAQLEAEAARRQKIKELEEEKAQMKLEAAAQAKQEWENAEGTRTQKINTILNRTGKSFEEIDALDDGTLDDIYKGLLFPKAEPKSKVKIDASGHRVSVDPEGNESYQGMEPGWKLPKEGPDPDVAEAKRDAAKEKWITDREKMLARFKTTEKVWDANGAEKVISTPKYGDPDEIRSLAENMWDREFGTKTVESPNAVYRHPPAKKSANPQTAQSVRPDQSTAPQQEDIEKASRLVSKVGKEKARAMLLELGNSPAEVEMLIRLTEPRGRLIGNPG